MAWTRRGRRTDEPPISEDFVTQNLTVQRVHPIVNVGARRRRRSDQCITACAVLRAGSPRGVTHSVNGFRWGGGARRAEPSKSTARGAQIRPDMRQPSPTSTNKDIPVALLRGHGVFHANESRMNHALGALDEANCISFCNETAIFGSGPAVEPWIWFMRRRAACTSQ